MLRRLLVPKLVSDVGCGLAALVLKVELGAKIDKCLDRGLDVFNAGAFNAGSCRKAEIRLRLPHEQICPPCAQDPRCPSRRFEREGERTTKTFARFSRITH